MVNKRGTAILFDNRINSVRLVIYHKEQKFVLGFSAVDASAATIVVVYVPAEDYTVVALASELFIFIE